MLSQQTQEDIDAAAKAERRETVRRQRIGQSRTLSAFIASGGEIDAEEIPGVGLVYRSRSRCGLVFDVETVERHRARKATAQRRLERLAPKQD